MQSEREYHPTYSVIRLPDGGREWVQDGWHQPNLPGVRFNPAQRLELKFALQANENIVEIAERLNIDHCTVLFWKQRFGLGSEQPGIDSWPGIDGE